MADATAATRALAMLRELAAAPGPMAAATVSRRLGIPRSSVYHLLTAMAEQGFVVHYPEDGRWGLGLSVFEIGAAYLRHEPLERVGRPVVHRLAHEVGDSTAAVAHLGVLHGRETVYLLREATPAPVTVVVDVGVRLPASLTASGRSMLAMLPPAQVRALFPDRRAFVDRTGLGPSSPAALRRILAEDERRSWSMEDGFIVEGYASVAAAVLDRSGRPTASIGLTFRSDRVDASARTTLAGAVRAAAQDLSRRLGAR
jgi:DNA-binding IclR family transcriptional regulator